MAKYSNMVLGTCQTVGYNKITFESGADEYIEQLNAKVFAPKTTHLKIDDVADRQGSSPRLAIKYFAIKQ